MEKQEKNTRFAANIVDKPGTFAMISKHDLHVDEYQREATQVKITNIANAWSWKGCGCILVAKRGERFFVVDGQHRVMAARKRVEIRELPCLVFETADMKEEAGAFLVANTHRKPVTTVQAFNALLISGDQNAAKVAALVETGGRRLSLSGTSLSSGTGIACVGTLMRLMENSEAVLRKVWPLMIEISRGQAFSADLIGAMTWIEARLPAGRSLTVDPWRTRVITAGVTGLLRGAKQSREYHGKSGERVMAEGVLRVLNHKVRTSTLVIDGMGE